MLSPRFCAARRSITSRCAICLSTGIPGKRSTTSACYRRRGERVSLAQLCTVKEADEGSEIYRENNQRYVAIKYSVRNRALGDAVKEAIQKVDAQVKLPRGYHIGWEGEYQSEVRAEARMLIIVPLTVLLIFIILYSMYKSFKWAL
jgi:cobalt-zinc-cadmium resistance protein CzcA